MRLNLFATKRSKPTWGWMIISIREADSGLAISSHRYPCEAVRNCRDLRKKFKSTKFRRLTRT